MSEGPNCGLMEGRSKSPDSARPAILTVLLCCYGDFPQYSVRALESVILNASGSFPYELFVGLNACGGETAARVRQCYDSRQVALYVESRMNRNKDPMMRLLLQAVRTPYVLWMDDDSILGKEWDRVLISFIGRHHPFDGAGHVFYCHRSREYLEFLQARPWFRRPPKAPIVWFPTGGLFVARTEFMREHSFPDFAMIKEQDDLLFGDCIEQANGKLVDFGHDRAIMDCVKISAGERRGSGEGGYGMGWLNVCPRTGFDPKDAGLF